MSGAIFTVFVVRELDYSPSSARVVFSLGGVGFLLGSMITARVTKRFGLGAHDHRPRQGSAVRRRWCFPSLPHDKLISVPARHRQLGRDRAHWCRSINIGHRCHCAGDHAEAGCSVVMNALDASFIRLGHHATWCAGRWRAGRPWSAPPPRPIGAASTGWASAAAVLSRAHSRDPIEGADGYGSPV